MAKIEQADNPTEHAVESNVMQMAYRLYSIHAVLSAATDELKSFLPSYELEYYSGTTAYYECKRQQDGHLQLVELGDGGGEGGEGVVAGEGEVGEVAQAQHAVRELGQAPGVGGLLGDHGPLLCLRRLIAVQHQLLQMAQAPEGLRLRGVQLAPDALHVQHLGHDQYSQVVFQARS